MSTLKGEKPRVAPNGGLVNAPGFCMGDYPPLLIFAGGLGWFLLTYVLGLGKKGPLRTLIWTDFYWFIAVDCLATLWGMMGPVVSKAVREGNGFRVACFWVLLPYFLSGCRLYWLKRHAVSGRDSLS